MILRIEQELADVYTVLSYYLRRNKANEDAIMSRLSQL